MSETVPHPGHDLGPIAKDPSRKLWFEDDSYAEWERLRRIWINNGGTVESFLDNLPEPPPDELLRSGPAG